MGLFAVFFAVGIGLLVAAVLFRILFERSAFGLYWDITLLADSMSIRGYLPVRPIPAIIALATCGAMGLFISAVTAMEFFTVLRLAVIAGLLVGVLSCRYLCIPRSDRGLVGDIATVEEDITDDGWGRIRIRYAGGPVVMRAFCADGEAVPKGGRVILLYYHDGAFVVEPEEAPDNKNPARMEESEQGDEQAIIEQRESD